MNYSIELFKEFESININIIDQINNNSILRLLSFYSELQDKYIFSIIDFNNKLIDLISFLVDNEIAELVNTSINITSINDEYCTYDLSLTTSALLQVT
jgi:uncharacterized protein YutD